MTDMLLEFCVCREIFYFIYSISYEIRIYFFFFGLSLSIKDASQCLDCFLCWWTDARPHYSFWSLLLHLCVLYVALVWESLPSIHCLYQYNQTIQEHTGEAELGTVHLYLRCPALVFFFRLLRRIFEDNTHRRDAIQLQ